MSNLSLGTWTDGHRLNASNQDSERDLSGSWLVYLTPLTAVILAGALVMALTPPAETTSLRTPTLESAEDARRAAAIARYSSIVSRPTTNTQPLPYTVVLVSSPEDAQRLPAHLAAPGAVNAVLIVESPEDERELHYFLGELLELRRSGGLPDPVIIDLREPRAN